MKDHFTLGSFLRKYKDDEACLEHLKQIKYPSGIFCEKCQCITTFTKITSRPVYQCSCGYQISPLAGTIFEKTTTPLQYWFYAIFIMSVTRSGVSAKQLQRELGVTYKTAWRMFKQIRILMANVNNNLMDGTVEVDETFIGGAGKNRRYKWDGNEKEKQVVMGMVQRNGRAYLKHIPNTGKWTLLKQIKDNVDPQARVITDEWGGYIQLPKYGYKHDVVRHKDTYVVGDIYTQNVENLWSILKRGIYGVYRVVSKKYLQAYIDEYAWRYNHRQFNDKMFDLLLRQVAEVRVLAPRKIL
ncbi:IS1595 family transposase [Candidatus Gottesmanbacteria bacterium]|nr:IS1595 family transposase [Candidatus Gottesmanbacteria bacterium]MBI4078997.1 IS1595 family transposase [Candidatus Levybacteria bacterium]